MKDFFRWSTATKAWNYTKPFLIRMTATWLLTMQTGFASSALALGPGFLFARGPGVLHRSVRRRPRSDPRGRSRRRRNVPRIRASRSASAEAFTT
jgi:hypothetical protein